MAALLAKCGGQQPRQGGHANISVQESQGLVLLARCARSLCVDCCQWVGVNALVQINTIVGIAGRHKGPICSGGRLSAVAADHRGRDACRRPCRGAAAFLLSCSPFLLLLHSPLPHLGMTWIPALFVIEAWWPTICRVWCNVATVMMQNRRKMSGCPCSTVHRCCVTTAPGYSRAPATCRSCWRPRPLPAPTSPACSPMCDT